MVRVFLSLGSNIDRYQHISSALDALQMRFGELLISPVYESEAVGFEGDNFLNLVVAIEVSLGVGELSDCLKAIEDDNGRQRTGPKFSARTLDIDILTYDDVCGTVDGVELPRDEVTTNAFVLRPLADVAPNAQHPLLKRSYQSMWSEYPHAQKLWPVDFEWQGHSISMEK
jgi:2-amino-4-hydroxy-6-hydroxymethyldihydropteridine diphosphokinase